MSNITPDSLREAATSADPVAGFNHDLYRYPARFHPSFARAAIAAYSQPGDTIYDPFVGGGTTLVEARLAGRCAVGTDISELAVFLSRVKTRILSESDIAEVRDTSTVLAERIVLRDVERRTTEAYYQKHLNSPELWPLQRTIERVIEATELLPRTSQRDLVRCVLLRTAQWAIDCRMHPPSAPHFREKFFTWLWDALQAAGEFRRSVRRIERQSAGAGVPRTECWKLNALHAGTCDRLRARAPFDLVVTSPPYVGTHVLYHRWQVAGRRETPAPFWVTGTVDGHGGSHYTLGDYRTHSTDDTYFKKIEHIFTQVAPLLKPGAWVIQMVGFADEDHEARYNAAMHRAGFARCDSFRRSLPGTRRFYADLGHVSRTDEHVLIHRRRK